MGVNPAQAPSKSHFNKADIRQLASQYEVSAGAIHVAESPFEKRIPANSSPCALPPQTMLKLLDSPARLITPVYLLRPIL